MKLYFQTLVAETLVLAKTHGYVEKIENKLEEELARDISDPTDENVLRYVRVLYTFLFARSNLNKE